MNKFKDDSTVILIDALNLFTRHYVAHPAMNINGDPVGGIVGFLYAITNLAEKFNPNNIIVVWESGGSPRRRAIYPDYKSKRRPQQLNRQYKDDIPDTVENRNFQISFIVECLNLTPICQVYVKDCEADDVIGYLSKYKLEKCKKLIVSSDKDFYQLLNDKTLIYSPTWKKIVTHKEVREKFSVSPDNFCLAKSVCGDPSDNIPGVKGVGFKTLSKRFPILKDISTVTIKEIVEISKTSVSEGSKIKAYESISTSEDLIRRNWKLTYLDVSNLSAYQIQKVNESIDTFVPVRNKIELMRTLIKEGIQTFNIDRMFLSLGAIGL
jgi:5'-3' exonuclease